MMIYLIRSFFNAILASICINTLFSWKDFIIRVIEYGFVDGFWNMVKMGICAFGIFFVTLSGIAFLINSIKYIILFYYYGLFYNYDKVVHVTVNEKNAISSYVEFSNGKTIPIKIHRVTMYNKETVDEVEQENKEE